MFFINMIFFLISLFFRWSSSDILIKKCWLCFYYSSWQWKEFCRVLSMFFLLLSFKLLYSYKKMLTVCYLEWNHYNQPAYHWKWNYFTPCDQNNENHEMFWIFNLILFGLVPAKGRFLIHFEDQEFVFKQYYKKH